MIYCWADMLHDMLYDLRLILFSAMTCACTISFQSNWVSNNGLLFVCLFGVNARIFRSYGDVTIAGEGLKILTYDQQ